MTDCSFSRSATFSSLSVLALAEPALIAIRGQGRGAQIYRLLLSIRVVARVFLAPVRPANVSFNNLGFRCCRWRSTGARRGDDPFVTVGARYGGVQGSMLGRA
jgi:hypothetical protein